MIIGLGHNSTHLGVLPHGRAAFLGRRRFGGSDDRRRLRVGSELLDRVVFRKPNSLLHPSEVRVRSRAVSDDAIRETNFSLKRHLNIVITC